MSICSRLQLWLYCFLIGMVAILFSISASKPPAMPLGWIQSDANDTPGPPLVTLLGSTAQEVRLRFDFHGLQAERVQTTLGAFTRLSGEGLGRGSVLGQPDLPVLRREVEIPWGAQVSLELVDAKYREVETVAVGFRERVLPLQPSTPKCGTEPGRVGCDESVYSSDAYFPASPVRLGSESELRGHRIITIEIWPALYQPVGGRLRLYSSLELRLSFSQAGLQAVNPPNLRLASPVFESILAERLINHTPTSAVQMSVPPQYLIISADLFASRLDTFIALKQAQGFAVTRATLSETGDSPTEIKAHIAELYTEGSPPDYLLLVGDDNFVPAWTAKNPDGGLTDLYYATMGGVEDYIPDILYGRLPVRNTVDLDAWLTKMLAYEQASGNENWAKGASFLATDDDITIPALHKFAYELLEASHNYVINTFTAPLGFIGSFPSYPQLGGDRLYAWTNHATHVDTVNAINNGRALVVYSGRSTSAAWVNPEFNQADVREMTGPPVTLALGLACNTANFIPIESLADTWVARAGSGALVYIGSSTGTFYEDDDILERAMFEKLFESTAMPDSLGQALKHGMEDIRLYRLGSFIPLQYQESYQLFGDPSLQILLQPKSTDFSIELSPAHLGVCADGQAEGSVSVRGQYGFTQPVNMSMPGLPNGLSATINPNPLAPGATGILTLDSLVSSPGDYPLTVTGVAGDWTRESGLVFSVHESPPSEVALLEPAPFKPNAPLRPTLTWNDTPVALTYDLQIASDHLFTNLVVDVTGLVQPRFMPGVSLERGTTYWWRVRAVNACGSSAFSLPERFTTLPPPGTCVAGSDRTSIYATDFEGDTLGWDFSTYGPWELKSTYSHSSSWSAFARSNLMSPGEKSLISPAISLPGTSSYPIELAFWSKHIFENLMECRDAGMIDVGLLDDAGNIINWNPVSPEQVISIPYDGLISRDHQNPLGNQFGWCGTRDWSKVVVSLDDYAGQKIKFRWHLGHDSSTAEGDGWYVDDVSVESCLYPPAPSVLLNPSESQIIGLAGETIVHDLELTNSGSTPVTLNLSVTGGAWSTQVDPAQLNLDPGATAHVAVSVSIPAAAAPGASDQSILTVTAEDDQALHAKAALITKVNPFRIELSGDQLYQIGYPTMPVTFNVLLVNAGVEVDNISLSFATPPTDWLVEPLESPLTVAPGASKYIQATVIVPAGTAAGTLADFTLEAVSQGNPAVKAQLGLQVQVQVVNSFYLYIPFIPR